MAKMYQAHLIVFGSEDGEITIEMMKSIETMKTMATVNFASLRFSFFISSSIFRGYGTVVLNDFSVLMSKNRPEHVAMRRMMKCPRKSSNMRGTPKSARRVHSTIPNIAGTI